MYSGIKTKTILIFKKVLKKIGITLILFVKYVYRVMLLLLGKSIIIHYNECFLRTYLELNLIIKYFYITSRYKNGTLHLNF